MWEVQQVSGILWYTYINTFLLTEPKSENVNNISACFQKQ